jgi:hypothetical protein
MNGSLLVVLYASFTLTPASETKRIYTSWQLTPSEKARQWELPEPELFRAVGNESVERQRSGDVLRCYWLASC